MLYKPNAAAAVELGTNLPLGCAQGMAEDKARSLGASKLIAKDAGWRTLPVTQKQLDTLRLMRLPVSPGITRGEASDLISSHLVRRLAFA